ncbi:hypothetical protein GCM10022221_67120 [Actinocorallia aurea]
MSSTTAKLAYGYDLDGVDDKWNLAEYNADTYEVDVPWCDADADLADLLDERLPDGLGVTLECYGSLYEGWSGHVLAAHVVGADEGSSLVDLADTEDWNAKLAAAIAALGITPTQEKPGWILCALES